MASISSRLAIVLDLPDDLRVDLFPAKAFPPAGLTAGTLLAPLPVALTPEALLEDFEPDAAPLSLAPPSGLRVDRRLRVGTSTSFPALLLDLDPLPPTPTADPDAFCPGPAEGGAAAVATVAVAFALELPRRSPIDGAGLAEAGGADAPADAAACALFSLRGRLPPDTDAGVCVDVSAGRFRVRMVSVENSHG